MPLLPSQILVNKAEDEFQRQHKIIWAKFLTRFLNTPPPRINLFPITIWQTDPKKNFNINVQLEKAVHGYLSPDRPQRASLLVFGVQLVSLRRKAPFRHLKLEAKVLETTGPSTTRPEILAHAPFVFEEALKKSEERVKSTREVGDHVDAEINAGVGRFRAGRDVRQKEVRDSIYRYFGKGASAITVDEEGKRSGIWWNVKQSSIPYARDDAGIDPNYHFAVLLTRARNDKEVFKVRINLEVHAGLGYLFENGFSHVIRVKDLDVDPRIWYVGDCKDIDRRRLEDFEAREKLVALTMIGT
jgi:hypothetical protein